MKKKETEKKALGHFKSCIRPCSEQRFAQLEAIIRSLGRREGDFLVVELCRYPPPLDFIQTACTDKDDEYLIELGIDVKWPHPRMFRISGLDADGCVAVFAGVCLNAEMPDLSRWEDITEEVFSQFAQEPFYEGLRNVHKKTQAQEEG